MIIYYNNKTGKIYGAILGRVHNEFEKKPNLIRPKGVKYADISRKILNLKDSIAVEEYLDGEQAKILDCEVVLSKSKRDLFIRRKDPIEKELPDAVETLIVDLSQTEDEIVANYSETTRRWLKAVQDVHMEFRELPFKDLGLVRSVLLDLEDIKDIKLAKHALASRSAFLDGIRRAYVVVDRDENPLAAAVITVTRNRFKYTLGGVTAKGREVHAGDFLVHNLIVEAKALGFEEFDLGGVYADWADDEKKKVNKFKERWGGKRTKLI